MRKAILAAAVLLAIWGLVVTVSGGLDTRIAGVAIRSRDPFRALVGSLALFLLAALVYRVESTRLLDRLGAALSRHAAAFALAAAAVLAAHGIVFGLFGVGGSDSYGYVNQAYDWAEGRLPRALPIAVTLPFEYSDPMQVPLGYRVGPQPHTMVPTYAPGLPLLMAVTLAAGKCGPFFVVPICAALFVWFTFRLGRLAGGAAVGLIAAAVVVTSPVVLYQTLWPMSDVPAGAIWTGSLVYALGSTRRSAGAAGLLAALGLLVRPNLALVAAVPLLTVLLRSRGRDRWINALLYAAPIAPVVVFVAILNTMWFGGPASTGYGSTDELYHASNIWPNVKLNLSWLWESQSPWVLLALVPLVPPFSRSGSRAVRAACVLLGAMTFASYASYSQFDVWSYLRFLMPAFGALAVLVAAGVVSIARTIPQPFGRIAAVTALFLMIASTISFASNTQLFDGRLRAGERRYVDIGEFAADHLPANAALFAVQHSGSLRFYSGRLTLRFDWVSKEWAAGVPSAIERAGYHPYLVVDDFEIPQVRRQFGLPDAPLPWPIVARMRELGGMTIFDMATSPAPASPIAMEPGSRQWCGARRHASR